MAKPGGLRPLTDEEREVQAYLDRGELPPGDHPLYSYEVKQMAGGREWFVTVRVSAASARQKKAA